MAGKASKQQQGIERQRSRKKGRGETTTRRRAAATAETLETWKSLAFTLALLLLLCCLGRYLETRKGMAKPQQLSNEQDTENSYKQVLHENELRLMTIAQLVNGTRESALLRVARLAKQFAQMEARKTEQEIYSLVSEQQLLREQVELERSGVKSGPTPEEARLRAARVAEIQNLLPETRAYQQTLQRYVIIREQHISQLETAVLEGS